MNKCLDDRFFQTIELSDTRLFESEKEIYLLYNSVNANIQIILHLLNIQIILNYNYINFTTSFILHSYFLHFYFLSLFLSCSFYILYTYYKI